MRDKLRPAFTSFRTGRQAGGQKGFVVSSAERKILYVNFCYPLLLRSVKLVLTHLFFFPDSYLFARTFFERKQD